MSRSTKIVLGVAAGLLALCVITVLAGVFFSTAVIAAAADTRPDQIAAVGAGIADYTLPAGYHQAFSFDLFSVAMIAANADSGHSHIYLAQLPPSVRIEQLAMDCQSDRGLRKNTYGTRDTVRVKPVGQMERTVRGQTVTFVVSEGQNSAGEAYREMAGAFNGKNGPAALLISGTVAGWDQATFDGFIASIR